MAEFDQHAFADAYAAAVPRLRRMAAALGLSPADIDDVLQEVYVELLRRPGEYRTPAEAHGWLTRVAVNICLWEYRRRRRFVQVVRSQNERTRSELCHDPTAHATEQAEARQRTRAALRDLPGELAVPLVLRYFCECDATQIGELLDLPPATVRGRLRRARLWLAERLADVE